VQAGVRSSADLVGIRVDSSGVLTIDLLPGAKPWQLLREDATERQEHPIAIGLSEGFPELREMCRRAALQRARGGTGRDEVCRMATLRAETVPGGAGTNRPASEAPGPRLWGAPPRIDKAELRG
jgi:hypothetical protein